MTSYRSYVINNTKSVFFMKYYFDDPKEESMSNACRLSMYTKFILKSELKIFGKPERTWEYNINVGLKHTRGVGVAWFTQFRKWLRNEQL
jgi:hypothetical protein